PERKKTVDQGGAIKLIAAAKAGGVDRYVIVSSMGAGNPAGASGPMVAYLEAKAAADEALATSGLDYTIVRPGRLTNGGGTGLVALAEALARGGETPRADAPGPLVGGLDEPQTIRKTFELLSGEWQIAEALRRL